MKKNKIKSVFTWRDYVFGNNILAGMLRMLAAIGAYILICGTFFWWFLGH